MRSGLMRERVSVESLGTDVAVTGVPSGGWSEVCSVRAQVTTLDGMEGYEADQNAARLTHEVVIRYRSGVSPEMRVLWGTRVLQVHGVVADPKRTRMVLQCEERIEYA